jgi:hypothetical protein
MSLFVVDVESDGPIIAHHSMVCFGAVMVSDMSKTFYGQTRPIGSDYIPDALAVSGFTRMEHEKFLDPKTTMVDFSKWLIETNVSGRPTLITDNPAYDFSWINWYFLKYTNNNPFGWSARRIGDLYCGLVGDARARWKHLRKTRHTHHPVDDAMGNAEVVVHMKENMGLEIKL